MEIILRGWIMVGCLASVILQALTGPDRPDITMLYKGYNQTCVAGSNTNGYGLAFMSETLAGNVPINTFEYRDVNGTAIDSSSDCDFEQSPGDRCWLDWRSDNLELRQSGLNPISPITDERWNNFDVYRTIGRRGQTVIAPSYDTSYNIAQENFFTGISVRSIRNAQILLCTGKNIPIIGACYWILIDGFQTFENTIIRKCVNGIPDKWVTDEDPDCKIIRANITAPEKLLDESKWTHFMLSREDGKRVRLWLWDLDTGARPLLDYTDDDPLSLSTMYVRSYYAIADWKVHEYQYANILSKRRLIQLGPVLKFVKLSSICVSLYVTLCSNCKLDIRLEREDGVVEMRTSIEGDSNGSFMTWRNVRLQGGISTSSSPYYQLYAASSTTDGSDENTFWAIDDFRKCSNNEIRVLSTYSPNNLLCQSLNHPNWQFNPNNQVKENEPPICSDGRYIGQHCNISCNSLNPKDGCSGQKICLPTQEGNDKGACTCAAGYVWGPNGCTQPCNYGFYGYNCVNKCGRCKNAVTCNINTGKCPTGCADKYLPPYCQTILPYLVNPPVIDNVYYRKITVKFNNLTITDEEDIVQSIQLECTKASGRKYWRNCSEPINFNLGQEISITGLEKQTTYLIRAIVHITTGDAYRYDDVPFVEATTTCKVDREIYITETSKTATIDFETETDGYLVTTYIIELRQNLNQIIAPRRGSQDMILLDLTPYTNYTVRVTNIIFSNYIQNISFQTKQDAPGDIKYVNILNGTDTTIVFSCQEPEDKNGIIQKYTITYELIKRIDCDDKPISQNGTMAVSPSMISKLTISGLQPYSTYYITVAAETILPGRPIGFQANTTIMSDISEEELPDGISTSNLNARSVTIRWPMNCVRQRGPLYFQILLKCVKDEWCDQIKDKVLDNVSSLNGGVTTYELTPFTHYSVELRAKRSQTGDLTTFSRTTEFYSLEENPLAVTNATHYSKDSTTISVRWLDPYPPHGHLEKYAITYCYKTWNCKTIEITTNQLTPCDLWNEHFNCYTLTKLYTNYQYTIIIKAKNRDIKLLSHGTILRVNTTEDKSSVPLNLTREWENNEIKLSWNHPDITNGRLKKFIITLNRTGTELKNQNDKPFYSYEYIVLEEMKTYSYKINKKYQHSSSFIVTVCGVNSVYGKNATIYIDTPPETPELAGNVIVGEKTTSKSNIIVIIPSKINSTVRFLFVVVGEINSTSMRNSNESNELKQNILQFSACKHKWIAIEISEFIENQTQIVIGTGESIKSQQLNETIFNHKLKASTDYELTFVFLNIYKKENSTKIYQLNVRTAAIFRAEFYALFLILLSFIAVAIFLCFRTKSKSRSLNNSRDMRKTPIEPDYGYLEPRKLHRTHTYLEIIDTADSEPFYSTPDLARDKQYKTEAEGHIYETIIYSTTNPPIYENLSKDVPIDEE